MSFKFQGKTASGEVVEWDMLEDQIVLCDDYISIVTHNYPKYTAQRVLKDSIRPVDDKVEKIKKVCEGYKSQQTEFQEDAQIPYWDIMNIIEGTDTEEYGYEERLKEIMED